MSISTRPGWRGRAPKFIPLNLDGKCLPVNSGDIIYGRLFSVASKAPPITSAQSILVFGRKPVNQTFRSPFAFANTNARTIVDSGPMTDNPNGPWLSYCGPIVNAPTDDGHFEFSFIAGALIVSNCQSYSFSHDPEPPPKIAWLTYQNLPLATRPPPLRSE